MNYNILATTFFEKEIKLLSKKYSSLKNDFLELLEDLKENPKMGKPLGKNCYKIRMAITSKQKGKSGGARIITFLYAVKETLFLLGIYDKSEKETLIESEIKKRVEKIKL